MISGKTKVVGLIGDPVKHSVSPSMQNAAFRKLGLDYVYVPFNVEKDSLQSALSGLKALKVRGVNVTIPHKSSVMDHLDEIEEPAKKIGAVNTIKREGQLLKGFNTDGIGAQSALKEKIDELKDKNIVILGAGGAARAISFTLAEKGANLTISNRTTSKAEELVREIKKKVGGKVKEIPQDRKRLKEELEDSNILINSTSVGMHPDKDETILTAKEMHSDLTVMDIVYNPPKTHLLKEAEKAGAKTISGLGMLVHQGATSFKIWTGRKAPVQTMKKSAKKVLEGK
ncbi:shikimate dehydrogenase [candidate division MSBL1 archaeon SCGC-AAA259E17]|uniref:Shikimate dehydrogenase (NADP(+)) n=1 Tax=candidate division MSBL1 archaeon SCGC-AAA259E17 TaxID=1698263 RepID=A0A133UFS9_9EURY|nr:shikimate dehydrogenase [candidate division MSBL1 archaeon SCGC-AAA259E17]